MEFAYELGFPLSPDLPFSLSGLAARLLASDNFVAIIAVRFPPPILTSPGEPVSRSSYSISGLAAAAIVLLRVGIGVHFLSEGWTKLENPKPFSAGFFGNAKGPFAPLYKNLVWDADGLYRLDYETTLAEWEAYRDRVVAHYGFDADQQKAAASTQKRYQDRLKQFLASKSDTIEEYHLWLDRRDKNATDRSRQLASLQ